jgi:ABC-type polysaccharide/polyol phosphate transport system ATPase subunit
VAPVIELGVGFEQELTGRENIIFNGALLGRSQQEMRERMDEIVHFAELEDFIDQPIRTYSTGMVARLAFAVATTVEATVLMLDEVLSVGDERFKLKCQERMSEFRNHGVTILFVSHDLGAVESLCDRAVWLADGRVERVGESAAVVEAYRSWAGSRREPE